ncbi:Y-family DNA polymerase [Aestuariirhabdus litorea]|uniref:Y-family DNA polymerase n=1 Tax=Aestuariirhabdus litorea TaxID=2528527 RepID=A0A3P3VNK3_9GAMM|nr:Y-family DNA polymerase [Aestuariirhabdus litorea]RRJ84004.1 Y-family DNA polymerase [Aestuariirhabdus litorea]RWW97224.1 DUF4113 domain-containing protein [Endozoicomonadaceae bacterium GTF-13]
MLALVDVNACYASCEAIFRPDLRGKPIVVLSNNDGCIVARSSEAKALAIPDLEPYFKLRKQLDAFGVEVFSSNYSLYGDISRRIMQSLATETPHLEIYSIDEAFLDCTNLGDLSGFGHRIRKRIWREQRVGVGVGIAPTKTLAKLANQVAKRLPRAQGVCVLDTPEKWNWVLQRTAVNTVWGIGRRLASQLAGLGVVTGADLAALPPEVVRQQFSVTLERTVRELNGLSCLPLEEAPPPKQQIVSSRSFGRKIRSQKELERAVAQHAWRAGEKLRQQGSIAMGLMVWINTSRFAPFPYSQGLATPIAGGTDEGATLCRYARQLTRRLYRPGYDYAKASVSLLDLVPASQHQADLFTASSNPRLNAVIDRINHKYGSNSLRLADQWAPRDWAMLRRRLSPAYTTRWSDIPVIECR